MTRPLLLILSLLVVGPLPACGQLPVRVTVTVVPLAELVETIGGELVQVAALIPSGASPETFEPSPRQIVDLRSSRLVVQVGHPDFPFERRHLALEDGEHRSVEVVDLWRTAQGLSTVEALRADDPHIWLSPSVMRLAADEVFEALARLVPSARAELAARHSRWIARLDDVDREIRSELAGRAGARFYVYHPAWSYFAREYGLEQVAIETEGKEPSPSALLRLIERARADRLRVVFVQTGFSDRPARVVAAEIGARIVPVDPLARDWLDNLRRFAKALLDALVDP